MSDTPEPSPWICHVCNATMSGVESTACGVCFKTTCSTHLRRVSHYNQESGLYELTPVCLHCALEGSLD